MSVRICYSLALLCCLLPSAVIRGQTEAPADWRSRPADWHRMVERIDKQLAERWAAAGIEPAPPSSDAEFLRRAHLDLCGTIPSVADVRVFLADSASDKRLLLVDQLLEQPDHATHLADIWTAFLLPGDVEQERMGGVRGFQSWLRNQFVRNKRYDNVVAELIVAQGRTDRNGEALFYTALSSKPEELAANTSRIFLGIQIQCAQCHDHPFNNWKQRDFWGYAAFFARVRQQNVNVAGRSVMQLVNLPTGEVKIPDSEEIVPPKYLGNQSQRDIDDESRRSELAIWLASSSNPYFAKATVNRVWGQLFGRGLVDPVDDLGSHNPPSHPELLDELADWFIESGFDLKMLYRVLANTRGYQLTSEIADGQPELPPELFARMAIKNMTAEQLYDALSKATLRRPAEAQMNQPAVRFEDPQRQAFVARFRGMNSKPTEFQSGIPQALMMMNGQTTTSATSVSQSPLLESLDAPFFTDEERVEALFLATLSRPPQETERLEFVNYVNSREGHADRRQALGDVLWALANSAEFALNH
jgi:hypothetical protein